MRCGAVVCGLFAGLRDSGTPARGPASKPCAAASRSRTGRIVFQDHGPLLVRMVGQSPRRFNFSYPLTDSPPSAGRQKEFSCNVQNFGRYGRSSASGIDVNSKSHAKHAIKTELRGGQISPPPPSLRDQDLKIDKTSDKRRLLVVPEGCLISPL